REAVLLPRPCKAAVLLWEVFLAPLKSPLVGSPRSLGRRCDTCGATTWRAEREHRPVHRLPRVSTVELSKLRVRTRRCASFAQAVAKLLPGNASLFAGFGGTGVGEQRVSGGVPAGADEVEEVD